MRVPILLVDDLLENTDAIENILDKEFFDVKKVASGAEAVTFVENMEFAVIVLDIQMPKLDGFQTAQLIRKSPFGKITPIIFVSGVFSDLESIKMAHSQGAVDFLMKPVDYEVLQAKLKIFSELFLARKKIEEQSKIFDIALSTTPNFHYIYDTDQRFTYVNKTLLDFWGKTLNDVVGKNVLELGYPEELYAYYTKYFNLVLETKAPVAGSSMTNMPDGRVLQFEFVLSPVFDHAGKIYAVAGTTQDTTERTLNERANFRNLFKQTSEIVCILKGPEHIYEFVNDAHIKVLGIDATGMKSKDAQPDAAKLQTILNEVYKTGKTVELHEVPVNIRSETRYFNLTYVARRDSHGEIDGIMVLGIELTNQVLARQKQLESQDQLNFALSSAGMGTWHVDLVTGAVTMSREAKTIFGYQDSYENADDAIDTFIHPEDRSHARDVFTRTIERRESYQDEYRIKKANGEVRWVQLRGRAQFDRDQPKALTGIVMDITDDKKAEEDLKRAVSIRDEFISIASHEFRTPVTALRLQTQFFSKMLKGEFDISADNEKLSKFIQISDRQLLQLTRLIEQMLDVSRIGSEKMSLDLAKVDLSLIARQTLLSMQIEFDSKNIVVDYSDLKNVMVKADAYKIEQVITNLVSNAIKYGEYKPIKVEVTKNESYALLKVSDQGMGIAPALKEKVFEKFERALSSDNISGLGLGLYIAKEIISAHGGEILLDSKLGKGSTFTIQLPLLPGD